MDRTFCEGGYSMKKAINAGGGDLSPSMKKDEYQNINISQKMTNIQEHKKKQIVVVLNSDHIGTDELELGKDLMKRFIYSLNSLDYLPKTILLYNSGAKLSCLGSASIGDLQGLADQGVEILTCGDSLAYYKLKNKLAVGSITDMYTIVEKQMYADLVVKP